MRILYKQTPMNKNKKLKICARCRHVTDMGEDYNLYKTEIICNNCVQEDEYISRLKIFRGSHEVFRHNGIAWNIEGILKDIKAGRRFEEVRIPTWEIRGINQDITILPEKIENADIEKPGIYAEFAGGDFIILDGHHRVAKALRMGVADMEFYRLSFKEHFEYIIFTDEKMLMGYLEQELN